MNPQILESFTHFKFPSSYFLTFEGIEGSGKSTQIQKLKKHLEDKGFQVLCLREPGGTVFGENLREAILASQSPIAPIAEAYLFASSRCQLLTEKILPFLEKPKTVVLLDRYIDSSLAYQGHARGLGIEQVLKIHTPYPLNHLPHQTFYLKIKLETSLERQGKRGQDKDYFESEAADFTKKLIDGYDSCAELFAKRFTVIDGEEDQDSVFTAITRALKL